ncbi:MAG TPA: hypothetical protein DCS15_08160 [Flavobacteriales bacterium]|jgi:HPt (histidine-containing phosphotransfer) domain-containing protein|nr:hypothetical protein [Salibacteraceae bacterium]HAS36447.1 hypothetical protein [Flavobacteriales bacterium]
MEKRYNLEKLESLSGGDANFIKQMVELFLNESESNCVRFEEYQKTNDYDAMRALAHKIKPTIDLMGLHPTLEEVSQLKDAAEEGTDLERISDLVGRVNQGIRGATEDLKRDF